MSIRIIDTNILSLLQDRNEAVLRNISQYGSGELCVTIISYLERVNGWTSVVNNAGSAKDKVRRYRNLVDTIELLAQFKMLTFTEEAIERLESFRVMKSKGKLKGFRRENDLKIAAITMDYDSIFVTQNVQHFKLIPGFVTIGATGQRRFMSHHYHDSWPISFPPFEEENRSISLRMNNLPA